MSRGAQTTVVAHKLYYSPLRESDEKHGTLRGWGVRESEFNSVEHLCDLC